MSIPATWLRALAVCAVTLSAITAQAKFGFQAPRAFDANANPDSIVAGDVNGDGVLDLVVSNNFSGTDTNNINVLLGNGDGSFKPPIGVSPQNATSGTVFPNSVQLFDFNKDGKLDLAAVDPLSAHMFIMPGNGDGTFGTATFYPIGPLPQQLVIADFNGDGNADVAVTNLNAIPGSISVLLGNGDGTLQAAMTVSASPNAYGIAAGDVNGDGKIDIVVSNLTQFTVSVLINNGTGTFRAPAPVFVEGQPTGVTLADLNGDGKLDIAVACAGTGFVDVAAGNGDGTFRAISRFFTATGAFNVAARDLNGDGRLDLIVLNQTAANVSVLLNSGAGQFQNATNYSDGPLQEPGGPQAQMVVADFDSNGAADIAMVNGLTVSILRGQGDGTFLAAPLVATGAQPAFVATADFNGDGQMDFAVANKGAGSIGVHLGDGNSRFANPTTLTVGSAPSFVAAGDVNGDGKVDLVAANSGSDSVTVILGNGDGTFQPATAIAVGTEPNGLVIADVNSDGKPDIVTVDTAPTALSGTATVLLGNGDGSFHAGSTLTLGKAPTYIAAGDLDHNGTIDLVAVDSLNNAFSILYGAGDGSFLPQQFITVPIGGFSSIALVDVNRDGVPDIVATNRGLRGVQVYINNGNRTFQTPAFYQTGILPVHVAAADLNGDGVPDLVVVADSSTVSVLRGVGDGTFLPSLDLSAAAHASAVAFADVNGDGAPDALIVDTDVNQVSVLLNTAGLTMSLTSSPSPSSFNQPVSLLATLTPSLANSGTPTGLVGFSDGATVLGSVSADAQGQASFSTQGLAVAAHSLQASYAGDGEFVPKTSAVVTHAVNRAATTSTIAVVKSIPVGDTLNMVVNIAGAFGGNTTGTVTLSEGSASLGSAAVAGNRIASVIAGLLAGPHTFTASYSGDGNFLPSTASATVAVQNPTAATLQASTSAVTFGSAVSFTAKITSGGVTPTGSFSFSDNAGTSLGSANLDVTGTAILSVPLLHAGVHAVTAAYPGDSFSAAATSAAVSVTVGKAVPTVSLASSVSTSGAGYPVTLTATVSSPAATPTGTVVFTNGSTTIGTASLVGGVARLITSDLPVGSNAIVSSYSGDADFASADSSAVNVAITPDFTVAVAAGFASVRAGQTATTNLTISPFGGFNSAVTFSCSGLPALANCAFNPPSVTPNGAALTTTLSITTTGRTVVGMRQPVMPTALAMLSLGALGLVGIVLAGGRKRSAAVISMLFVVAMLGGCGGGGSSGGRGPVVSPSTPVGTYTVTVTATTTVNGASLSHSIPFNLIVNP